jgi:hypothetical protein
MNDIIHEHLDKLRVISMLRECQKLSTSNGQLSIYDPGIFSWLLRNMQDDSKESTIIYLQGFYRILSQTVEQLIIELKHISIDEEKLIDYANEKPENGSLNAENSNVSAVNEENNDDHEKKSPKKTKYIESINVAVNIAEKIKGSIKGLENLSKTYSKYQKTMSSIEGIVQDYAIVIFKKILDVIPYRYINCKFRDRIMYYDIIMFNGI